jgi:hypothetical protein
MSYCGYSEQALLTGSTPTLGAEGGHTLVITFCFPQDTRENQAPPGRLALQMVAEAVDDPEPIRTLRRRQGCQCIGDRRLDASNHLTETANWILGLNKVWKTILGPRLSEPKVGYPTRPLAADIWGIRLPGMLRGF